MMASYTVCGLLLASAVSAASQPSVAHVNQCLGGSGQVAIGPGVSAIKKRLLDPGSSANVVPILAVGDELSGVYHWTDLIAEAFGNRVDIDLTRDVLPDGSGISPGKGENMSLAVSRAGKAGYVVVSVSGLEQLSPVNILAANVLMPLMDDSQRRIRIAGGGDVRFDNVGLVVVLVSFDYRTAPVSEGTPQWDSATSDAAKAYLRTRLSALHAAHSAGSEGLEHGQRTMNVDALLGRVKATFVLPPLYPDEVKEWKMRRMTNPLCKVTHAGYPQPPPSFQEQLASSIEGALSFIRSALPASLVRRYYSLDASLRPLVDVAQVRLRGVLGGLELPPAVIAFVVGLAISIGAVMLISMFTPAPKPAAPSPVRAAASARSAPSAKKPASSDAKAAASAMVETSVAQVAKASHKKAEAKAPAAKREPSVKRGASVANAGDRRAGKPQAEAAAAGVATPRKGKASAPVTPGTPGSKRKTK